MAATAATVALKQDASNRAFRTFLQGLGIDVLVAVSLVVYDLFNSASQWDSVQWTIVGFALVKTVLVTAASYIMRRFMDRSGLPTPLPPLDPGPPADTTPDPAP